MTRPSTRSCVALAASILAACVSAACGLSLSGTAASSDDAGAMGDGAATDGTMLADGASPTNDGGTDAIDAPSMADTAIDAPRDAPCVPFDAGLNGPLALSAFALKGNSIYDNNGDGKITLTNSNNHEHGAAWYPAQLPPVAGFDVTWTLRVGPGDTSGDGLVFAVLQAGGVPGVGDDGDGVGLRNLPTSDGGTVSGFAVVLDTYKTATDNTDLGPTTLKLVAMPGFVIVTGVAIPFAINDGNIHAIDVSWRAPSTLTATFRGGDAGTFRATSTNDARLTVGGRAYFGFTGATGGSSDSHNEIAGITIVQICN